MSAPWLSAHRQDEEPWRLERLQAVVRSLGPEVAQSIAVLRDHKGTLSITWRGSHAPPAAVRAVHRAWREQHEHEIEHLYLRAG